MIAAAGSSQLGPCNVCVTHLALAVFATQHWQSEQLNSCSCCSQAQFELSLDVQFQVYLQADYSYNKDYTNNIVRYREILRQRC